MDRAIAALAGRQHGVVSRGQLLEGGIGTGAIEGRLMRGQLHRVHRAVYAVGHRLLSTEGRWMAAVLAGGRGTVLSHRSAAAAWQLLPRSTAIVDVTRPRGWRTREAIRLHCSAVPQDERTWIDGVPVTSVSRTLLDLAAVLSKRQLAQALNEAEVLGLTDSLSIPGLLRRYPRRHGSAALRTLLESESVARGITRSELEERFVDLLAAHDLPPPRLNATVAVGGRFLELDCFWPDRRLAIELDGRAAHGTARAFERDRARDRLLIAAGWRVVRLTWRQVSDDAPAVVADLRRLLQPAAQASYS